MFERTRSFWRRLLGQPGSAGTSAVATGEERRVWVRFPADLETSFIPAGSPGSSRFSARVRNISLGGINLLGDRPFQPGELLTVELPGATRRKPLPRTGLRGALRGGGPRRMVAGCTFSRELNDEDLESFGARRETHASPPTSGNGSASPPR